MSSWSLRARQVLAVAGVALVASSAGDRRVLAQGAAAAPPRPAAPAAGSYTPAPENLKAREWFQDAKFGLFIHWGVYSVLGDGEWIMNNRKIRADDYEKLPAFFNPTEFNPVEWVSLAKAAGMKYITITSKHHDGFAMFDSKVSTWDIVDRTPYKKDVLKALAEECRKQGIKLFFYHSHLDWHNPDYYPRGRTGNDMGRPNSGEWYKYLDYMDAQLTELLTNYGEIGGIWFDGWWDRPDADWRLEKTYSLIHKLQPQALIGNNHHRKPFAGEDFQMFEKDLPGHNTAGFNEDSVIGDLPLETCETINGAWGFNLTDRRYKSLKDLVHYLVRASGYNANFLLNVGPMPNGKLQPEFVKILQELGAWTTTYGESLYGTRGGPISPRPWGATTQKGNIVYVHILNWEDEGLLLQGLKGTVKSAKFVKDGKPATFTTQPQGVVLSVPASSRDAIDTVVALELQK
jgi:alpha-L-fucosidase